MIISAVINGLDGTLLIPFSRGGGGGGSFINLLLDRLAKLAFITFIWIYLVSQDLFHFASNQVFLSLLSDNQFEESMSNLQICSTKG